MNGGGGGFIYKYKTIVNKTKNFVISLECVV